MVLRIWKPCYHKFFLVTSVSSPAKAIPACYRFGPFRLQPHPGVLYRGGELVALAPKAFGVLLLLVENAGNVVPKQEILDKVWAGLFVEDTSLTKNISILRKILNEGFPGAEVIRTVSKVGYQLAVLVSLEPEAAAATPVVPPSVVPPTRPPFGTSCAGGRCRACRAARRLERQSPHSPPLPPKFGRGHQFPRSLGEAGERLAQPRRLGNAYHRIGRR